MIESIVYIVTCSFLALIALRIRSERDRYKHELDKIYRQLDDHDSMINLVARTATREERDAFKMLGMTYAKY